MRVLRLCLFFLVANLVSPMLEVKWDYLQRLENACRKATSNPFFKPELVFGRKWKVYYMWEKLPSAMCMTIQFRNISKFEKQQIRNKLQWLLKPQPNWDAPGMLLLPEKAKFNFVLFADENEPGKYTGFTNFKKQFGKSYVSEIPQMTYRMTLIHNSTYLVVSHCDLGWTVLASYLDPPPTADEIDQVVTPMKLNDGFHTCYQRKPAKIL